MSHDPPVTLDAVQCIAATDDALLVYVPAAGEEVWLPRSQIINAESDDLNVGDTGSLTITAWIAEKKGLL